jgi:polysaccharide pyruvyl transferase WcaK-like protein
MSKVRIVIAGEIYSPNLGDGLIFETMKYLYHRLDPLVEIIPLDISGRTSWKADQTTAAYRLNLIAYAKRSASRLYTIINSTRLEAQYRQSLRQRWRRILAEADMLVIGGGQLLMDDHLDFPLKLNKLTKLAVEKGLPVHISACGVGGRWSARGQHLIREVLSLAESISLRDRISIKRMERFFPGFSPRLTGDPAIWAAQLYEGPPANQPTKVGLGVINIFDLNLHHRQPKLAHKQVVNFWLRFFEGLAGNGYPFELFTNGNLSDERFARLLAGLAKDRLSLFVPQAQRPLTPAELVRQISWYRGVMAFRLHALLLAASYLIPCIGLGWDEKVGSLFEELQLSENVFPYGELNMKEIFTRLRHIIEAGVEYPTIDNMKAKAILNPQIVLGRSG